MAADIAAAGGKAVLVEGDVAQRGGAERVVDDAVAALGRLDILDQQCGRPDHALSDRRHIGRPVRPADQRPMSAPCSRRVAAAYGTCAGRAAAASSSMSGSVAGRTGGGIGSQIYAGAKAFVATFSRSLAKEVVGDRIRVNVVSPGVIATDMQDRVSTPAQIAGAVATIPMGARRNERGVRRNVSLSVQRRSQRLRHRAGHRGERRTADALRALQVLALSGPPERRGRSCPPQDDTGHGASRAASPLVLPNPLKVFQKFRRHTEALVVWFTLGALGTVHDAIEVHELIVLVEEALGIEAPNILPRPITEDGALNCRAASVPTARTSPEDNFAPGSSICWGSVPRPYSRSASLAAGW